MATPSGQIAFSQVNAELGVSPTSTQANLGSAPFRGLAGVPSGQISMSNLQNKSNFITASISPGPGAGVAPGSFILNGSALQLTNVGDYTVTFSSPGTINVIVWGSGGGMGFQTINTGGAGSKSKGIINVVSGQNYIFSVGGGGTRTTSGGGGTNGGGNVGSGGYAIGGGGGYSGVFYGSKTFGNSIIVSGGGGGGGLQSGGGAVGGSGGYPSGQSTGGGGGGTQISGGSPGGGQLVGGAGAPATAGGGGGGGGYYGGGGGAGSNSNNGTGAGGGSSYFNPTYVPTPSFTSTTPNSSTTSIEPSTYYTTGKGNGGNSTANNGSPGMITLY